MRLSRRSYPHPVVGNLDDVPGAAFQATVEMSADPDNVYIDATIQCSSTTLRELVQEGRAAYAVHVECTNTVFRSVFEFREDAKRITIRADQVNDSVEVNVFAVAKQDIPGYAVEKAHTDYDGSSFDIQKGDIIAVAEGRVFEVHGDYDVLGRIGSIMQIEEATSGGDLPMQIDFSGEKIRVILSKPDFKSYRLMRNAEALSGVLTTTLVLPAILETLYHIDAGAGELDEIESLRWFKALSRRIQFHELQSEGDKLVKAQKLLELPVKRALANAQAFAEASS